MRFVEWVYLKSGEFTNCFDSWIIFSVTTVTVNGFHQGSKVILITDGEATESLIYAGPDVILPSDVEEVGTWHELS